MSIAVIAMALFGLAYWQRAIAVEQSILAEEQRRLADQSALRAKSLEDALREVDASNPLLRP